MSERPFSFAWMLASLGIFIGTELILGGLVGEYVVGRYASISLKFMLQGLLNLVSYFIGGLIIGVVSPGVRIREPAAGAFLAVALMLSMSLFTPYSFIRFSVPKLLVGGAIAYVLALTGARLGEKLTGQLR